MNEIRIREMIAHFAKSLFLRGFSVGSAGNISVKLEDGILITPTNSSLGDLDPTLISKLDADGRHVDGDPPSKEIYLHQAFYRSRPDAAAVVHLHSSFATAHSCRIDLDPEDCLPALTPYVLMRAGRIKLIPYARPGARVLGDAILALEGRYSAVLLANHGSVVGGTSLRNAVFAAEEIEEAAKICMLTRGLDVGHLDTRQIAELLS